MTFVLLPCSRRDVSDRAGRDWGRDRDGNRGGDRGPVVRRDSDRGSDKDHRSDNGLTEEEREQRLAEKMPKHKPPEGPVSTE